jgi:hypothetical protein
MNTDLIKNQFSLSVFICVYLWIVPFPKRQFDVCARRDSLTKPPESGDHEDTKKTNQIHRLTQMNTDYEGNFAVESV